MTISFTIVLNDTNTNKKADVFRVDTESGNEVKVATLAQGDRTTQYAWSTQELVLREVISDE